MPTYKILRCCGQTMRLRSDLSARGKVLRCDRCDRTRPWPWSNETRSWTDLDRTGQRRERKRK